MSSEVIRIVQLHLSPCPVPHASLQLDRSCANIEEDEVGTGI